MWLVDGLNVIGSRADGWWRDRPAAMRALIEELEGYAAASEEELVVVFDGKARWPALKPARGLTVVFAPAPGPGAADDEIVRRVSDLHPSRGDGESEPAPEVGVVTSDRALAERVRARGARVQSARAFSQRLRGSGATPARAVED